MRLVEQIHIGYLLPAFQKWTEQYQMNNGHKATLLISLLIAASLPGCSRPTKPVVNTAPPLTCDFTQFVNQNPEFVKSYFPSRQWETSTAKDWNHIAKRPVTIMGSSGDLKRGLPYIGALFYDGKLFEVEVFFFEDISPEEAARRVGLPLSAFHVVSAITPSNRVLRMTGTYKGVKIRELDITDHPPTSGIYSRNVIASFFDPGITKAEISK